LSIDLPISWRQAIDEIAQAGGVCIVLGAVDTGKSTFCSLLASAAARAGKRAAVVDADVGQSDVGPPACVSMGLLTRPIQRLAELSVSALHFVGSTSPPGHLLPAVVGARLMVEAAQRADAHLVVVDTTGLITGALARALKTSKIDALHPNHLVALQRRGEVEHLLAAYTRARRPAIHRLPVSAHAQVRPREQRTAARQAAFERYFQSAVDTELALSEVAIQGSMWRSGQPLPGHMVQYLSDQLGGTVAWAERSEEGIFAVVADDCGRVNSGALTQTFPDVSVRLARAQHFDGLLVGVMGRDDETLGMGILRHIDFESGRVTLHSPVRADGEIAALRMGSLRLATDYSEVTHNRPGATG